MIYMMNSASKHNSKSGSGDIAMKKGLLANSRTSFEESKTPLASNDLNGSFDVDN